MTLTSQKKKELAKKFGDNESNVGSIEVQIAMLTERIKYLESHFKTHKKDNHSRQGLLKMIMKRRSLMKYLKKTDITAYEKLIKELGLRK